MPQSAHGVSGLRCVVSGRVQGVFFRASTQEQARALGLNGYARNLPDGRVEILACGPDSALASLREWLHKGGPAHAEVHGLDCEPHAGPVPPGFAIR